MHTINTTDTFLGLYAKWISKSQKDKYRMIPLVWSTQESSKPWSQKVEQWALGAGVLWGAEGVLFNGYRVSVLQDGFADWLCDNVNMFNATEIHT